MNHLTKSWNKIWEILSYRLLHNFLIWKKLSDKYLWKVYWWIKLTCILTNIYSLQINFFRSIFLELFTQCFLFIFLFGEKIFGYFHTKIFLSQPFFSSQIRYCISDLWKYLFLFFTIYIFFSFSVLLKIFIITHYCNYYYYYN